MFLFGIFYNSKSTENDYRRFGQSIQEKIKKQFKKDSL